MLRYSVVELIFLLVDPIDSATAASFEPDLLEEFEIDGPLESLDLEFPLNGLFDDIEPVENAIPEFSASLDVACPVAPVLRAVLLCDGEFFQLEGIFDLLCSLGTASNVEFLKIPAGTSFINQPNDLSPSFRVMKAVVRSDNFLKCKYGVHTPPTFLQGLTDLFQGLPIDPASRKTFLHFFRALPDALHLAYSGHNIRDGWAKSGVYPFSVEKIFGQCLSYDDLSVQQKDDIFEGLPQLVGIAREKGKIPDADMVSAIKFAYTGHEANNRDYEKCPLNYDRALWINHPGIVALHDSRTTRKRGLEDAGFEDDEVDEAAIVVVAGEKKARVDGNAAPKKARREKHCSSTHCNKVVEPMLFTPCSYKDCKLIFCVACHEEGGLKAHELVCSCSSNGKKRKVTRKKSVYVCGTKDCVCAWW